MFALTRNKNQTAEWKPSCLLHRVNTILAEQRGHKRNQELAQTPSHTLFHSILNPLS